MRVVDGRPSYDLPSLYLALTRTSVPPPEIQRLCHTARLYNSYTRTLSAVVEAGEAWVQVVGLLVLGGWSGEEVGGVVGGVMEVMVREDAASLALAGPLSAGMVQWVGEAGGGGGEVGVGELMDAVVNHQHAGTRCNLYALLLLFLRSWEGDARAALIAGVTGQGGRVMALLLIDATEGGLLIRAIACALLSHVIAGSPSAIPFLRQGGVIPTAVTQLVKRDEDLRMAVLSPRPSYLPTLHQYISTLTLCTQLACTPAGRELLIDADAIGQLTRLTAVDLLIERDLQEMGTTPPTAASRYYSVLSPLLRLMSGMLCSRHTPLFEEVLGWLRGHQELIFAVVKERRAQAIDEAQALQLMAQLLERVEGAGRAAHTGREVVRRGGREEAPLQKRGEAEAAAGGVTGHLRGLLKFVGVSLPGTGGGSQAAAPLVGGGRVVGVAGVMEEDARVMDRSFLMKPHKRLLLHLQSFVHSPAAAAGEDEEVEEGMRALKALQEATVKSVLNLCCMRVEYGGNEAELPFAAKPLTSTTLPHTVDPPLGLLIDAIDTALDRIQEELGETGEGKPEDEERRVQIVELGLLLLLHHVQVYEGGRVGGEGWKEEAKGRILPVLEKADGLVGDRRGGVGLLVGVEDDRASMSTALVVAGKGNGKKRMSEEWGPQSLFVSAFTRRLRQLLV